MKKLLVIMMGLGISMAAQADERALTQGGTTNVDPASSHCQALDEAVDINLSANVFGHVDCPDTYTIQVATCHDAGRKVNNDANVNVFHGTSAGGSVAADTSQTSCDANAVDAVAAKAAPGS